MALDNQFGFFRDVYLTPEGDLRVQITGLESLFVAFSGLVTTVAGIGNSVTNIEGDISNIETNTDVLVDEVIVLNEEIAKLTEKCCNLTTQITVNCCTPKQVCPPPPPTSSCPSTIRIQDGLYRAPGGQLTYLSLIHI